MEWHSAACRKLDLVTIAGLQSCMRCGSIEEEMTSPQVAPSATVYAPIRQQLDIRVLRLQPGLFHDPLEGELSVVDLSTEPDFEAISYTWKDDTGDDSLCRTISIGGSQVAITSNCEMALRRVRYEYTTRRLWMDSICIDQSNNDERGHQVRLMARIYSGAFRVLIYIGESGEKSDSLLDTINGYPIFPHIEHAENSILSRSYFRRLWVLQEVALARRATLICGNSSTPWVTFVEWFKKSRKVETFGLSIGVYSGLPPVVRFDYRTYTVPHLLLDLLSLAVTCEAGCTHDKVYALLGLLPNATASGLVVDYCMPIEQVFGMTSVYAASICGWSRLLKTAATLGRSLETLPSWIPDWSSQHNVSDSKSYKTSDKGLRCLQIIDTPTEIPLMQDAWQCALKFMEIQIIPDGISTTPVFQFPGDYIDPFFYNYQLLHKASGNFEKEYICLSPLCALYAFIKSAFIRHDIPHHSTHIMRISLQQMHSSSKLHDAQFPGSDPSNHMDQTRVDLVGISISLMWEVVPLIVAECSVERLSEMVIEEYRWQRFAASEELLELPFQLRRDPRIRLIRAVRDCIELPPEVFPKAPVASLDFDFESLSKADSDEERAYNCLWKLILADFHWTLTEKGIICIE